MANKEKQFKVPEPIKIKILEVLYLFEIGMSSPEDKKYVQNQRALNDEADMPQGMLYVSWLYFLLTSNHGLTFDQDTFKTKVIFRLRELGLIIFPSLENGVYEKIKKRVDELKLKKDLLPRIDKLVQITEKGTKYYEAHKSKVIEFQKQEFGTNEPISDLRGVGLFILNSSKEWLEIGYSGDEQTLALSKNLPEAHILEMTINQRKNTQNPCVLDKQKVWEHLQKLSRRYHFKGSWEKSEWDHIRKSIDRYIAQVEKKLKKTFMDLRDIDIFEKSGERGVIAYKLK